MLDLFRSRVGFVIILIILVFIGIALRATGNLGIVQDATFGVFAPVQTILLDGTNGITNLFGGFQEVNALRAQVKQLQEQLNTAVIDSVRVRELEIENSELRSQLQYKQDNPDYLLSGATVLEANDNRARVISQDPSTLVNYVIIDQGRDDQVAVGMPVVTSAGLVGRITEIGSNWSRVLIMNDTTSSVNAVVQSTRATGIVQGQGQGSDLLVMRYLPLGDSVKEGDLILTSGIGGAFPKRLVIGQVIQVRQRDTDLFTEAIIRSSVDLSRLEFVLVMKKFTPTDITTEPTPTPAPSPTPTKAATAVPAP